MNLQKIENGQPGQRHNNEQKSDNSHVSPSIANALVGGSYVYVITFYDYDHDIIKHVFLDEKLAETKHKELQENRTWGFYNLHKKTVE